MSSSIVTFGQCETPFKPTIEDINKLLKILTDFNQDIAAGADSKTLFNGLLTNFLLLTNSEYGFIGERHINNNGLPYLKTHAISNISWNDDLVSFYDKFAPAGLEFDNLDTLFGHVILTRETLISNDPGNDPLAGGLPEGHPDLNAFLGIPLLLGEKHLGMVGLANREGGYDTSLLDYIKPLISSTISLIHASQQERMASHDPLTGLTNRRKLDESFKAEISRQKRHNNELSLLVIDIDDFKSINDKHGHTIGDYCLVHVAKLLTARTRTEDIVARYGGEEFVILLPDTSEQEAKALADQLRVAVSKKPYSSGLIKTPLTMTISIGAVSIKSDEQFTLEYLIDKADEALYVAKKRGKNQVCVVNKRTPVEYL